LPGIQIDQFRDYDRIFYAVQVREPLGAILADRDDQIGTLGMFGLETRLQRHAEAGRALLKASSIG